MLSEFPLWASIIIGIVAFFLIFTILKKALKLALIVGLAIIAAGIVITLLF